MKNNVTLGKVADQVRHSRDHISILYRLLTQTFVPTVLRVYMDITSSDIDEGDTAELIVFYSGILHQGSTVGVMVTTNSDTAMG